MRGDRANRSTYHEHPNYRLRRNPPIVRVCAAHDFVAQEQERPTALVMTEPVQPSQPANHTEITLEQRGTDQLETIQAWFYPGDVIGHEFLYPDSSHTSVPPLGK